MRKILESKLNSANALLWIALENSAQRFLWIALENSAQRFLWIALENSTQRFLWIALWSVSFTERFVVILTDLY
ncbi:hypothetical protein [Leptospira interrogans]|uniref:hypothetical protein n=1 Tax=Leptospira interrogans TaxID=173 RepID=UPI00193BB43B|nr:hypothetical protein [Leptospira interrogans]MBM2887706.1 hypothetical protein [Leptospira interrogans]